MEGNTVNETSLEGIEAVRVIRAGGDLTIIGGSGPPLRISADEEPDIRRTGATAEIYFPADAELGIPPGVAVEVVECAGHLEVEEFPGNLSLSHVAGHFNAGNVGPIAIRGNIDGRCSIEGAGAIAGRCVKGELLVERAQSVSFDLVAGHVTCVEIAGDVSIERIGGHCRADQIGGDVTVLTVGGKLEADRVKSLKADTVGGKLRALQVAGDVVVATVGGKVSVDGASNVAIATIGGHASVRAVSGNVEMPQVGGAARLAGHFAPSSNWHVTTGGRMLVELGGARSIEINAVARHGRVRVFGVQGDLRFAGRDRLSGKLGAGECKLSLETTGSDIIIEGEEERGNAGARFRWRDIGAPFESLAENLGQEIPEMVAEIVGAAGRIVAETGSLSGGLVRGVTRGVGEAMREVEREIADLKREIPEQAGEKLSRLGHQIHQLVNEALEERRCRSRAERDRIRERIREETRRMRDAIREARRGRAHGGSAGTTGADESHAAADANDRAQTTEQPAAQPPKAGAAPYTGATKPLAPDQEIVRILTAVRAGEIAPEEADDLIRALMEVERAENDPKPAA
jgi:hypothetical protein